MIWKFSFSKIFSVHDLVVSRLQVFFRESKHILVWHILSTISIQSSKNSFAMTSCGCDNSFTTTQRRNSKTALHQSFPNDNHHHNHFTTSTMNMFTMNHPNLLEEIESNNIPVLELTKEIEELFEDDSRLRYDDIHLLLEALSKNMSIQCIRFEGDFLDCLHPLQRSKLLRIIGSYLPGLLHVGLGDSPILVADLCHLVSQPKQLLSLRLHDSILQGTLEEFETLEGILARHSTIREFEIHECTSAIPGTNLKSLTHIKKNKRTTTTTTNSPPTRGLQQRRRALLDSKRYRIDGERKV